VEIRARVSGILEKRLYDEGQAVRAGTVLFRIDPVPYRLALRQAQASLGETRARQEQAQREARRLKDLAEQRAIGEKEYDDAVSTLKLTTASIGGAEANVAEAKLNLSYTEVTAPIGGITGRAQRSEGSLVSANTDSALLTTLTQVNPIWIRFSLSVAEFDRIRAASTRPTVNLLGEDGKVVADKGKVNFLASTVDPQLGTVQLRAEFVNPNLRWLPGQFVHVQILAGDQQAYLIPQTAVVQTEQARNVWVVGANNVAATRAVQTANWIGSDWVITDGLQPGDQVIIDNILKLRPGISVSPHAAPSATASASAPAASGAAPAASAATAASSASPAPASSAPAASQPKAATKPSR
jgi:membrane fusion protein (multidrug efflux system)